MHPLVSVDVMLLDLFGVFTSGYVAHEYPTKETQPTHEYITHTHLPPHPRRESILPYRLGTDAILEYVFGMSVPDLVQVMLASIPFAIAVYLDVRSFAHSDSQPSRLW